MDDKKFDELLRSRIGEYKDPAFDPEALAGFHSKIATGIPLPWHSRFRTELIAGTVTLLCAGMIFLGQYFGNGSIKDQFSSEIKTIQDQASEISLLRKELENLGNFNNEKSVDTIRIIEYRTMENTQLYSLLLKRIADLENQLNSFRTSSDLAAPSLSDAELPSSGLPYTIVGSGDRRNLLMQNSRLDVRDPAVSRAAVGEIKESSIERKQTQLPARTIRELEKHYTRGVGIRIGPTIKTAKGYYSDGKGIFNIGGGIATDFILSPSLSLQTGFEYSIHTNKIGDAKDSDLDFPDVDPQLGQLRSAEIDFYILEIPFYLRYRYPITDKTYLQTGIGYSSIIFTKEEFDYDYELTGNPSATINTVIKKNGFSFNPGTINLSIGLTNELKNKKMLETSIFYQYGIGPMGEENVNLQFLGIRGIYWFPVR